MESPALISLRQGLHYIRRAQAIAQAGRGLFLRADYVPPDSLEVGLDLLGQAERLAEQEVRRRARAEDVANEGGTDD